MYRPNQQRRCSDYQTWLDWRVEFVDRKCVIRSAVAAPAADAATPANGKKLISTIEFCHAARGRSVICRFLRCYYTATTMLFAGEP